MGNANIIMITTVEILSIITRLDIYMIFALMKKAVIARIDHFRTVTINKIYKIFAADGTGFGTKIFVSHKDPWTENRLK